jgi:hypothetical protein
VFILSYETIAFSLFGLNSNPLAPSLTCNFPCGLSVPMPTYPFEFISNACLELLKSKIEKEPSVLFTLTWNPHLLKLDLNYFEIKSPTICT